MRTWPGRLRLRTGTRSRSGEATAASPDRRPFRPDIQGLRAVAVMLVVAFHAGVPGITGGYVGVDVFYVISGFLITGILVDEIERTGTVSLRSFYAGRPCSGGRRPPPPWSRSCSPVVRSCCQAARSR